MYDGGRDSPVWIVSDCRRATDIKYFEDNFDRIAHVRVQASDEVRRARGWAFQAGVDDADSECGLDGAKYDIVLQNDGGSSEDVVLKPVLDWVKAVMEK